MVAAGVTGIAVAAGAGAVVAAGVTGIAVAATRGAAQPGPLPRLGRRHVDTAHGRTVALNGLLTFRPANSAAS